MPAFARGLAADAGSPEAAALPREPLLDGVRLAVNRPASLAVVLACRARERVGEARRVARQPDESFGVEIKEVSGEESRCEFRLAVARRHEDHQPLDLAVGYSLEYRR